MIAKLSLGAVVKILKPFVKKNPNNIFPGIEKLFKVYGKNIYKENTTRLKGTVSKAWQEAGGNLMTGRMTGAYGGAKDPKTGKRIITENIKDVLRKKRLEDIDKGIGMNLPEGGYGDPSLKGGIEGLIKGALGSPLRDDKASIKGILSLARAADLYNPGTRANILQKANLMKYNRQIQPYLAQLDDVERQIRYWLSKPKGAITSKDPTGRKADVKKIKNLMTDYANLKSAVNNEKYWQARGMTWGHPAGLKVNIENVLAKGRGSEFSKYLTTDPKSLTRFDPEIGPLNIGKDPMDINILRSMRDPNIPVTRKGLDEMSDIYEQAGIRSILPSLTGKRMILGKHDIGKQIDFLTKSLKMRKGPFEGLTKKEIQKILTGYQAGGLVSLIGKKALQKLLKKLSKKEIDIIKGSLWKGVDPKKSSRYRAWAKDRFAPGYKWPWARSRVRGPEYGKRHFSELTLDEKIKLKNKYEKKLKKYWEDK